MKYVHWKSYFPIIMNRNDKMHPFNKSYRLGDRYNSRISTLLVQVSY